jgi:GntR family transcriptional regulator/MocR family aminotransferase
MTPVLEMPTLGGLWLDRSSRATLQEQLSRQIKELIQSGVLAPGDALPSTREMAIRLGISRNTAVNAYDRLLSEGYLESVTRSGLFVSSSITLSPHSTWPLRARGTERPPPAQPPARAPLGAPVPFRPSQPDVSLFPLRVWNRLRARALRFEGPSILHYQSSCEAGLPALRQNVAAYLRDHRGVQCDWRQVVITSGSQQALYILATQLLGAGDQAYVEDPGYVEVRLALRRAGGRVVPGPLDAQGLRLPARSSGNARLIYTTPSRQFPTGVSLSLARRLALIDYAGRTKAWVIEDDYDSELRYGAPPLPSLQSLDRSGRVIYVGTFSKLLFPSLRLGYVVVPETLVDGFVELEHLIDDHLPLIDQATLALFLESGAFYTHIRRCRRAYAERQALFIELSKRADLPLDFPHTDGGMNLAGLLPAGADDAAWSARLRVAGLDVPALSHYAIRPTRPGLVFGFTAFSPAVIRAAFARLRAVFAEAAMADRLGRRSRVDSRRKESEP